MPTELDKELTTLRRALLSMSASAELRVTQAYDALLNRDSAVADAVRVSDDEIDDMENDIEAECLRILALQHPVASDLRYVIAALRINADLERIADLARGIAKRVIYMSREKPIPFPRELGQICDASRDILSDALRALAEQDAELASRVRRADKRVDALHKSVYNWAINELPSHAEDAQSMVDLLFIARAIERIADLATNIAEDVIFSVGGDIVRHTKPAPAPGG